MISATKLEKIQALTQGNQKLSELTKAETLYRLPKAALDELYELIVSTSYNKDQITKNIQEAMSIIKLTTIKPFSSFVNEQKESQYNTFKNEQVEDDDAEFSSDEEEELDDEELDNEEEYVEDEEEYSDDEPEARGEDNDFSIEDTESDIEDNDDIVDSPSADTLAGKSPLAILAIVFKKQLPQSGIKQPIKNGILTLNYNGERIEVEETLDDGFLVVHSETGEETTFSAKDTDTFIREVELFLNSLEESVENVDDDQAEMIEDEQIDGEYIEETNEENEEEPEHHTEDTITNHESNDTGDKEFSQNLKIADKLAALVKDYDLIKIEAPAIINNLITVDDVSDILDDSADIIGIDDTTGDEVRINVQDIEVVHIPALNKKMTYIDLFNDNTISESFIPKFNIFVNSIK